MSTKRAAALASAALTSAKVSLTQPRATPLPFALGRGTQAGPSWRPYEAVEGNEELSDDEEALLSSRDQRLSPAARFGQHGGSARPMAVPARWNRNVQRLVDASNNKKGIRQQYVREQEGIPSSKSARPSALLHLTAVSPSQYATLRNVLGQVKTRLGEEWMPRAIVEHGCGAGEGLWAGVDVFGQHLREYTGIDSRVPLLRSAIDLLEATVPDDTDLEAAAENPLIDAVDKTFKSSLQGADFLRKEKRSQGKAETETTSSERDTLVLCTNSLSSLSSDTARSTFVQSLWDTHPRAEVLVFVESGDARGFATIASAREDLLGIGPMSDPANAPGAFRIGQHVYFEEGTSEAEGSAEGKERQLPDNFVQSHVIAPCPHDKPCPLLHDYYLLDPTPQQLQTKTSSASPLFHGAAFGLGVCNFPQRAHLPSYSRKTRGGSRNETTSRHSFLVVRRGPRPSMDAAAEESSVSVDLLKDEALRAREGRVEELRGPSIAPFETPEAEIEPIEDAALTSATENEGQDDDDAEAREELFKLLPQALARELERAGDGSNSAAELDEAMRMAQQVMQDSAELTESSERDAMEDEEQVEEEDEKVALTSALLSQARQLQQSESSAVAEEGDLVASTDVSEVRDIGLQSLATSLDAYTWPRLIRTPLKKGGHVTLDACSPSGSIQRFTISKSTGKQAYHEARKANWGDLFPRADEGKGLVERVAPADVNKRNMQMKRVSAAAGGGGGKKNQGQQQLGNNASSAMAIGADAVAPVQGGSERRPMYSEIGSPSTSSSTSSNTGRRQHYKGNPSVRRDSRKRSMGSYEREINEAWSEEEAL